VWSPNGRGLLGFLGSGACQRRDNAGVTSSPADSSLSTALHERLLAALQQAGGWLPFDHFMAQALYAPDLGYYMRPGSPLGRGARSGSDFVTAPELSPAFGHCLAAQVAQGLALSGANAVLELGAGSGALAEQVLERLNAQAAPGPHYFILELSGNLRAMQAQRLARFGSQVQWLQALPTAFSGVVLANEVLDALPVKLLTFDGHTWLERGVVASSSGHGWAWQDRPTALRPPRAEGFARGAVTEVHPQAEALVASLAAAVQGALVLFIDYGFPEAEYYLPERHGGTLMCHRGHRADAEPLLEVGDKDITAHVNFTGIALAAQAAGWAVLGYSSQAHVLLNLGLAEALQAGDARARADGLKLINEHEMGELFKVLALGRGLKGSEPLFGFVRGDRTHRL
jgi:SAM-dependent MidA family methyltransferase